MIDFHYPTLHTAFPIFYYANLEVIKIDSLNLSFQPSLFV